jgi:hypothetical protein
MLKYATFAEKSKYCNSIDKSGRVIYDAEKYLFNNPAYMTHNFQKKQLFMSAETDNRIKTPERALRDATTNSLTSTLFDDDMKILNFCDLIFHTLNAKIMCNINNQLIKLRQPLLNLYDERCLVIFKGGNLMHFYYNVFEAIISNIIYNYDITNTYTEGRKFFKISDADFSLYLIAKNPERYNLLYSIAVPLLLEALKDLQVYFENIVENVLHNRPAVSTPPIYYTINTNTESINDWSIFEITVLDELITDHYFLENNLPPAHINYAYDRIILLFKLLLNYNGTRNCYILYHSINYLVILKLYFENRQYTNFIGRVLLNLCVVINSANINKLINDKMELLEYSLAVKRDLIRDLFTSAKLNHVLENTITDINNTFDKTVFKLTNNTKFNNIPYGNDLVEISEFVNFTPRQAGDPADQKSHTPLLNSDKLGLKTRGSYIIEHDTNLEYITSFNISTKVKNTALARRSTTRELLQDATKKTYNYITFSTVSNTMDHYRIGFSLLRIKLNFVYDNSASDLHIIKNTYKYNHDGTIDPNPIIPDVIEPVIKMPSEMVDLSIGHFTDSNYEHFVENLKYFNDSFHSINFYDDKQDFLIGYSIKYLIYDLYQMLFIQTNIPWNDPKYAKRLDRFFFAIFMNLIQENIKNYKLDNTFDYMGNMREQILTISGIFLNLKKINELRDRNSLFRHIINLIEKYFKFTNIIQNEDLFISINQNYNNTINENKPKYDFLGYFMKTVLHFIYNNYICHFYKDKNIYNFYYNISKINKLQFTNNLKQYLGKDINDVLIPRPRNPNDKDIVNDVFKYSTEYIKSLQRWFLFFSRIINNARPEYILEIFGNSRTINELNQAGGNVPIQNLLLHNTQYEPRLNKQSTNKHSTKKQSTNKSIINELQSVNRKKLQTLNKNLTRISTILPIKKLTSTVKKTNKSSSITGKIFEDKQFNKINEKFISEIIKNDYFDVIRKIHLDEHKFFNDIEVCKQYNTIFTNGTFNDLSNID